MSCVTNSILHSGSCGVRRYVPVLPGQMAGAHVRHLGLLALLVSTAHASIDREAVVARHALRFETDGQVDPTAAAWDALEQKTFAAANALLLEAGETPETGSTRQKSKARNSKKKNRKHKKRAL